MTISGGGATCPQCDAPYQMGQRFCGHCGHALPAYRPPPTRASAPGPLERARQSAPRLRPILERLLAPDRTRPRRVGQRPPPVAQDNAIPYFIPLNRVILLTFLTTGFYLFYWMYITWRHYRDYTEEQVFPVWHALSMLVPIYQFFRLHAHVRVYQELMAQRGVPSTLHPMRTVGLYSATVVLLWVTFRLTTDLPVSPLEQLGYFGANIASVAITAWIIWQVQSNINRFWQHRVGVRLTRAPINLMQIVMSVLGALNWILWIIVLLDPTLLLADPAAGVAP
jgi:hypothetical protein